MTRDQKTAAYDQVIDERARRAISLEECLKRLAEIAAEDEGTDAEPAA